jgi:Heterokaryon incompatibility protein (HET)
MQLPLRNFLASDIFGLIIDAINISQDTPLERLAQITMMDRIHGSAHFTNVATTGDNSSTGLPGIHSRSCGDTHQPFGGVCGFGLTKVRSSECEELEVSKRNLSAWTFQEKPRSCRTLILTKSKVIIWCAKTVYGEDTCMEGAHHKHTVSMTI